MSKGKEVLGYRVKLGAHYGVRRMEGAVVWVGWVAKKPKPITETEARELLALWRRSYTLGGKIVKVTKKDVTSLKTFQVEIQRMTKQGCVISVRAKTKEEAAEKAFDREPVPSAWQFMDSEDNLGEVSEIVEGKCQECHDLSADLAPDPYESDLNNDQTPVWMCARCRAERAAEL